MKRFLFLLLFSVLQMLQSVNAQMAITSESWDSRRMREMNVQQMAVQNSYEVLAIAVDATIRDQIAEVSVTQTIYNPGNQALEVEIFFPLPNGGIVQNFMCRIL